MAEILHQLIGSLSHYLQGFIHPRWLFGISEPSTVWFVPWNPNELDPSLERQFLPGFWMWSTSIERGWSKARQDETTGVSQRVCPWKNGGKGRKLRLSYWGRGEPLNSGGYGITKWPLNAHIILGVFKVQTVSLLHVARAVFESGMYQTKIETSTRDVSYGS